MRRALLLACALHAPRGQCWSVRGWSLSRGATITASSGLRRGGSGRAPASGGGRRFAPAARLNARGGPTDRGGASAAAPAAASPTTLAKGTRLDVALVEVGALMWHKDCLS